jgi:hypothetical protein
MTGRLLGPCAVVALAGLACGYAPVYGPRSAERFSVVLVRSLVPEAAATEEVLAGVRERFARERALSPGDGYPRVELEVLRADEASAAVTAWPAAGASNGERVPLARGMDVTLVARAWLRRAPEAEPERDTGDLTASALLSIATEQGARDPRAYLFSQADALRAVGRQLGARVAMRVLGFPAPSEAGEAVR